ncbi:MAG: class I SAM-dependent methyltransferase [Pseudomonadota bacterium]
MSILGRLRAKRKKFYDDDFDWDVYTDTSYARQLDKIARTHGMIASEGELRFDPATNTVSPGTPPLHENALLIMEAIGRLGPGSVHEVGCGGGDHMGNAARLFPGVRFSGSDRSEGQLDLLRKRHPGLGDRVMLQDLTMPFSDHWPQAELVFSQAVIMHIHTAVSHFVALSNMMRMAGRYVLWMENVQCHEFVAEVQALHAGGHSGWDVMHLYRFDGSHGAAALLASKTPLDLPPVTCDADMRAGVTVSERRLRRSAEGSARATYGPATPFAPGAPSQDA